MKKSRYSETQIVKILKKVETDVRSQRHNVSLRLACCVVGISDSVYRYSE